MLNWQDMNSLLTDGRFRLQLVNLKSNVDRKKPEHLLQKRKERLASGLFLIHPQAGFLNFAHWQENIMSKEEKRKSYLN